MNKINKLAIFCGSKKGGNELYVQRVMMEELAKAIGIAPAFSVDKWAIENLKYTDGSKYIETVKPENVFEYASKQTFVKVEQ